MGTRISKSGLLAVSLILMLASIASANPNCKTIFAIQHDTLITEGCTSPIGFCAGGTFTGNHGFHGNFFFSALNFLPIANDGFGRLVVPGTSTYTTSDGVLTISDVSVFDSPPRGTFAGIGRIISGTGRFAGATGDVFTTGRVSADGLSFTTDMTADICFAN